jgi:hypothetical protein
MQKPRTLGEAYALTKIQEEYLATAKRSARPSYEANMNNWGQPSSQQAASISDYRVSDSKQLRKAHSNANIRKKKERLMLPL